MPDIDACPDHIDSRLQPHRGSPASQQHLHDQQYHATDQTTQSLASHIVTRKDIVTYDSNRRDVQTGDLIPDDLWIFGYGSLCWRPSFEFVEQQPAWLQHFERVWAQGSTDHRGIVERPGRVVTIVPNNDMDVLGMAFRIAGEKVADVLDYLDVREQGGYVIAKVPVYFHQMGKHCRPSFNAQTEQHVHALVYVAVEGNNEWLGAASIDSIAQQIISCRGPSGQNSEYLIRLAEALLEIGGSSAFITEQTWQLYHIVKQHVEETQKSHFERCDSKEHLDQPFSSQISHITKSLSRRQLHELYNENRTCTKLQHEKDRTKLRQLSEPVPRSHSAQVASPTLTSLSRLSSSTSDSYLNSSYNNSPVSSQPDSSTSYQKSLLPTLHHPRPVRL